MDIRRSEAPSGKLILFVGDECNWDDFPARAAAVAKHFGMTVTSVSDGLDERLQIARSGDAEFCISWDPWLREVSVMAWRETPDEALQAIVNQARAVRL